MKHLALSVAAISLAAFFGAPAKANDDLTYKVVRGDTLIGLADKYMLRASDYRIVQKRNRIANPHVIPVGTILKLPRTLLKFQPSTARLSSVKGQVTMTEGNNAKAVSSGQLLSEGQAVKTSGGAFASLVLEDGSRISVPSNTDLKIVRLRRYILESALDYDFQVDRGSARSKVAPLKSANDRYQVRTPRAVSAVRGTDFQTRFDYSTNRDFAEVDEGALAVGVKGGSELAVPAGSGLAVNADGSALTEALLPPLAIDGAGKLQNESSVRFALAAQKTPVRVSIAKDAGFEEQLADQIVSGADADFGNLDDGAYFFRARAISAKGLEGLPATYAFKRRLNTISGSAGSADEGWVFKWSGQGRGTIRYNFQLFRNNTDGPAFVDEAGLAAQQIILSELPDGDYYWRVGSVQFADGETNTNWTPLEKIIVASN
ncbi:FecR domain-containing protein [uncultured Sphingorhabdus sp.]|uniref:FecR domain-containing protein n=1 Tax=uncultured Sphingorhabdus sp. TaxID=1686106 RepID=UPI00262173AD|nr:FecR domain-containing protein [uncultured Sphingorhabdus sp.]HMS21250.1 FecR domain-containing protein [Sphingorhabdus sp.]